MKHFSTIQKQQLKALASQFRRDKISMAEYHFSLSKFYNN